MRQLPAQEEHVETGAIQFGDDTPGFYFRGIDIALLEVILERYLAIQEIRFARPTEQGLYQQIDNVRQLIHDQMKGS